MVKIPQSIRIRPFAVPEMISTRIMKGENEERGEWEKENGHGVQPDFESTVSSSRNIELDSILESSFVSHQTNDSPLSHVCMYIHISALNMAQFRY